MGLTVNVKKESSIRIGFEYEGLIKNSDNKLIQFSEISPSDRKNIYNNYYCKPTSDKSPVDRYNCLAEIKTHPIILRKNNMYEDVRCILETIMNEILHMNSIFNKNGYHIDWNEQEIPKEIHFNILRQFDKTLDINNDTLSNKKVYTINKNNEVEIFKSKDNKLRGGGLHITISGIEHKISEEFIKTLFLRLNHYCNNMKSVYRSNILFREKIIDDIYLFEFMSFGMNIPNRFNIFSMFEFIKHNFHWCDTLYKTIME